MQLSVRLNSPNLCETIRDLGKNYYPPAIPAPIPFSVANTEVMNLRASNVVRFGENGVMNAQIR